MQTPSRVIIHNLLDIIVIVCHFGCNFSDALIPPHAEKGANFVPASLILLPERWRNPWFAKNQGARTHTVTLERGDAATFTMLEKECLP